MFGDRLSFVTPYWAGAEFMRIHLASIRRFYPSSPILVSKRGGGEDEMEEHRAAFGVQYWLEECGHFDALLRLFERCRTDFVCVLDHDAVLLSTLDPYMQALDEGRYELVGVEERIREPAWSDWARFAPEFDGWLRLAPGQVDCNVILFNVRAFIARWGLRGVLGTRPRRAKDYELDYGIGQRLTRHKYLLPYHAKRYGLGNLLMDGDTPVVWHQWFGSHRQRLAPDGRGALDPGLQSLIAIIEDGQRAFLKDYPRLDLSELTPAWGPDRDTLADAHAIASRRPAAWIRALRRLAGWRRLGAVEVAGRACNMFDRWRRLS